MRCTMSSPLFRLTRLSVVITIAFFRNVHAEEEDDYYRVLGLDAEHEDVSERDIKSAWRKLSKKHHPDVAGESQRVMYQRIQRAYEVLGDRRRRKIYDILGTEGLKKYEKPQEQGRHQSIFDTFFSFIGGESGGNADRGSDEELMLLVTLEDMYKGAAHTAKLPRIKICRKCRGTGARSKDDYVKCPHCGGGGRVVRRVQIAPGFIQQIEQVCGQCGGGGRVVRRKCPVCGGHRLVRGSSSVSIDIEQGTPNGYKMTYEMEADQQPNKMPGDLIFTIVTIPHPEFARMSSGKEGVPDDLSTAVELTLKEALLGFNKTLKHLDGRVLSLVETGVTKFGQIRKYAGEGMPRHHVPSERGNLLVLYTVELPKILTEEQRKAIERALD
ncbi:chaperone protein DNAj, putative [Trypanosoma equiperdum]|uniref:Chaperone protein DnaJ, putative n=2 Tax=Trypanozoon TaxID=39700 RepID=Q57XX6_TRYB2|nr:chaperone protein DnaJ, putative [Trypanosoma brucei brucei TREU927]AAX69543.1 chaperone protein DnaJ, putative [Trypanosoma brucei]AAZ10178.1 chaperone protein DnaJ, putative [Trypanosoma brucei brucei TREU927]SCU69912.1 chaperone protein DNAj, putative [Trypanosoma equiperdum]